MIVCLDTNFLIYLIERIPGWGPKAVARFAALRAVGDEVAVCDVSRLECLLKPVRMSDKVTEGQFRAFFADPNVKMLPVTTLTWESAVQIGAKDNFKVIDSLHLACAAEHGCGLFLTADVRLGRCSAIPVEVLA